MQSANMLEKPVLHYHEISRFFYFQDGSYPPSYYYHYTRLTALFPGLPRWVSTRKENQSGDFTEARDSEWQWHQLGHMQDCTLLQTDNHASTQFCTQFCTGWMLFLPPNQQRQSTVRQLVFLNLKFLTSMYFRDTFWITLPNFAEISHSVANILQFFVLF